MVKFIGIFVALATLLLVVRGERSGTIAGLAVASLAVLLLPRVLAGADWVAHAVVRGLLRLRPETIRSLAASIVVVVAMGGLFPDHIDGVYAGGDRTSPGAASPSRPLTRLDVESVDATRRRFRIEGDLAVADGPCATNRDVSALARGAVGAIYSVEDTASGWVVTGPLPPGDLAITVEHLTVTHKGEVTQCESDVELIPRGRLRPNDPGRTPRVPEPGVAPPAAVADEAEPPEPARPPEATPPQPVPPPPEPARPDPE